jgi:hypothetical protein
MVVFEYHHLFINAMQQSTAAVLIHLMENLEEFTVNTVTSTNTIQDIEEELERFERLRARLTAIMQLMEQRVLLLRENLHLKKRLQNEGTDV